MGYEPTTWKDGDLVTSAKLNKIEQGISNSSILFVTEDEEHTLNKTWQEIHDANLAIIKTEGDLGIGIYLVTAVLSDAGAYAIAIIQDGDDYYYVCNSADGYPQHTDPVSPGGQ